MPSPPNHPATSLPQAFHDLRTPLTVLRGRVGLARRGLERTAAPNQVELLRLLAAIDQHIIVLSRGLDSLERRIGDRCV